MSIKIAVHGGAGTILKSQLTPELELAYITALKNALKAGFYILQNNGTSTDAVEAAVVVMEDFSLFNAGKGSVFTNQGNHEMDAAIMDGKNLAAGAIAGVKNIKNPISLAKKVMLNSDHILLLNAGAELYARQHGVAFEDDNYFYNDMRYAQWQSASSKNTVQMDHVNDKKFGTVGAVALDVNGNLAAATSTGGMTNKTFGRVGDSPLIGSGTYANNATCAVSCTGHGEFFIQKVVAYDVSCLIEYAGLTLQQAADRVIHDKLKSIGGDGGLIALDTNGHIALTFNTDGMYRGQMDAHEVYTAIYK